MSLFENVIGAKTNFVRTDKNNVLTAENTFNGVVNLNGAVNGLNISDIDSLETELNTKASHIDLQNEKQSRINSDNAIVGQVILKANQTALNSEITNRTNADAALQNELITKSSHIDLQNEITNRENADIDLQNQINTKASSQVVSLEIENRIISDTQETTQRIESDLILQEQISLKLNEANSVFFPNYTKYVVDNRDNVQSVINSITNQGTVVYLSSGSLGSGLIIDKQNIALIGPKSTPPILEILQQTTTAITADRIRMCNIQIDGVMNAGSSRSVYTDCVFTENVNILASQTSGYMTFESCSFASGKTINIANNFANVIYFINCNFLGCSFSLNQASNQQVIFNNCANFLSFPANATYVGINLLNTGYTQNSITKTILSSGTGSAGQVLTSGGLNGADTWTTPSGGGGGGVNLETIMVIPKGQTITTKSGQSLTFQNVNAVIDVNQLGSFSELGGRLTYLPPTGTKLVRLSYTVKIGNIGSTSTQSLQLSCRTGLFPPSFTFSSITHSEIVMRSGGLGDCPTHNIEIVINIDPSLSDDIVNGTLQSWTTPKNFWFIGSRHTQNVGCKVHSKNGYGNDFSNQFAPPVLKIEAFS